MNNADFQNIPKLSPDFSSRVMETIMVEKVKRENHRLIYVNILYAFLIGIATVLPIFLLDYFGILSVNDIVQLLGSSVVYILSIIRETILDITINSASLIVITAVTMLLCVNGLVNFLQKAGRETLRS